MFLFSPPNQNIFVLFLLLAAIIQKFLLLPSSCWLPFLLSDWTISHMPLLLSVIMFFTPFSWNILKASLLTHLFLVFIYDQVRDEINIFSSKVNSEPEPKILNPPHLKTPPILPTTNYMAITSFNDPNLYSYTYVERIKMIISLKKTRPQKPLIPNTEQRRLKIIWSCHDLSTLWPQKLEKTFSYTK